VLVALVHLGAGARAGAAPAGPAWRPALLAALPYALLAALALAVRTAGAPAAQWTFFAGADRGTVVLSMLGVLALDARLLVMPLRFAPFYDWSLVLVRSPLQPDVVAGALLALVLLLGPFVLFRRRPRAALLVAWMAVTLLPVMNLVPFTVAAGERLLYLPAVGFVGLAALGLTGLAGTAGSAPRLGRALAAALVGVALLAFHGAQTVRRTRDWRDDETLLRATVRDYPESVAGRIHLARHLARRSPPAADEACQHFRAALALEPTLARVGDEARVLGCVGGAASAPTGAPRAGTAGP
jgi:hypothetical protein